MKADRRVGKILALLHKVSEGIFSRRLSIDEQIDETDPICKGINSLGEVSEERAQLIRNKEERINELLDVLLRYTVMDFSRKADISVAGDEIDALAAGLNAMADEVVYHHGRLRDSEEKIRLLNASLSNGD